MAFQKIQYGIFCAAFSSFYQIYVFLSITEWFDVSLSCLGIQMPEDLNSLAALMIL